MTKTKRKPSINLTHKLVEAIVMAGYEIGIESAQSMVNRGWTDAEQVKAERDEDLRSVVERTMSELEPLR